jgi:hypothetical protein
MSENVDEFLAHYGVPGMHWGHRKSGATSTLKPTTQQITEARARQSVRKAAYKSAKSGGNATSTAKAANAFMKSPDRVVAAHMTKGEKIATALLGGGLSGIRASNASHLSNGKVATDYVLNSYLGVASIPVQKHRVNKIQIQQQS